MRYKLWLSTILKVYLSQVAPLRRTDSPPLSGWWWLSWRRWRGMSHHWGEPAGVSAPERSSMRLAHIWQESHIYKRLTLCLAFKTEPTCSLLFSSSIFSCLNFSFSISCSTHFSTQSIYNMINQFLPLYTSPFIFLDYNLLRSLTAFIFSKHLSPKNR